MYNYILKSWVIVLLTIFVSCTDRGDYKNRYIIENATERTVKIKFYKRQRVGKPNLVFTKVIAGSGVLYDKIKNLDGVTDTKSPEDVFGADSLAVIFDGEKFQPHYSGLPFGNSLAFFIDYIQDGDANLYIITEENYQNAMECDGGCN